MMIPVSSGWIVTALVGAGAALAAVASKSGTSLGNLINSYFSSKLPPSPPAPKA